MAKTKALATTLLTIFIVAFAGSQEPIPFERRREFKPEALWNLLASPKFKTLQGKIQVTVFLPEGSRSWEMNLWADENRSRVQFELPHPEGRRQIITFTSPSEVWVWLPFAKKGAPSRREAVSLHGVTCGKSERTNLTWLKPTTPFVSSGGIGLPSAFASCCS
jgi:hypothetical protein